MSFQTLPWDWSFEPAVVAGIAIAVLLYARGTAFALRAGLARRVNWWRCAAFAGGLALIVLALESPIDDWSDTFLWAHMIQHLLLIFGAAPLLLFGAPLMPFWRAVPLELRRSSLRWLMLHPRPRRLTLGAGRLISSPALVWVIFVVDFIGWHMPALYDLALRAQPVHDLEHLLFLVTALLFWAQVIPSAPLRPRLGYGAQAFYTLGAGFAMQVVCLMLTFSPQPIYDHYAAVESANSSLSPIVDQTTSGGLMNLIGMIFFGTIFMVLLWLWLGAEERRDHALPQPQVYPRRAGYHG
jgi:putative membrane protein